MTPEQSRNFDRLLAPRHIAFIGGADAGIAIGEARRRGFSGTYLAVNPKRSDIAGVPCVANLANLPEVPDAVFLAIRATGVIDAVRDLAAMGAGGIVCYSAGFKEAGKQGALLEAELKEAAGDMALIGPNCYGLINYVDGAALWPFAHGGYSPGFGAAIITQSGMFSSDITMSQRSLPLAYMVSGGNQTILGTEDFIDAFADKPEVRAIGVHIEGLQDVPGFEQACLKALRKGKPVVALKTGISAIGSALTVSHTGSLSGDKELYQALFKRCGVISVSNPSQFLETLKYLCVVEAPAGPAVAGFTCSGGGATMLADRAEDIGLEFPSFDPDRKTKLTELLPPIATVSNPLDYTTPIWGQPELTQPVFETALKRTDIHAAILIQDYPLAGLDDSQIYYRHDALAFAKAARTSGIPAAICATIPENMDADTRTYLIELGVAPMQGIHEAMEAIRSAAWWRAAKLQITTDRRPCLIVSGDLTNLAPRDEAEGKAWLVGCGVAVPKNVIATGPEAAEAAVRLGLPVAVKMLSRELLHKTEAGTVAIGLGDEVAVALAVTRMRDATGEKFTDRFLIEQMAPPPIAELIVSIRRDAQFGLAMTLGSGGILTELIGDATTVLLPATESDFLKALKSLKITGLLNGYRGGPKADIVALSRSLFGLAEAIIAGTDAIGEIEINPLFVYENDILAVDALLHVGNCQQQ